MRVFAYVLLKMNRGENMSNKVIEVQNIKVNVVNMNDNDYICISDFTKLKEGKSASDLIPSNSTGLEKVQDFILLH